MTHYRALPGPVLSRKAGKGADAPFLPERIIRELSVNRLSRHILTAAAPPVPVFHGSIDNSSAPVHPYCFLHIQDGLLAKEDEELPLARHVVGPLEHLYFVKNIRMIVFVWAQEIIVDDPESQIIVGAFDVVKAVCFPVRSLIGPVQPFHDLFEWTVFFRHSIVVGKSNPPG